MRYLGPLLLGLGASFLAACSASSSSSSSGDNAAATGPLQGTYSADSDEGASPFVSITFLDSVHYEYLARDCNDDTDCEFFGTYVIDGSDLVLTNDGSDRSLRLPLTVGSTKPADESLQNVALHSEGLVTASDGGVVGPTLNISLLFKDGQIVVTFTISGTSMSQVGTSASSGGSSGSSGSSNGSSGSGSGTRSGDDGGTSLVTNEAIVLGDTWITARVPYCGGVNGGTDFICGGTCDRTGAANEPEWNAYRSDCSGYVSYMWGLAAPGQTTKGLAPMSSTYSYTIPSQDLQTADAMNSGHHVMLFSKWVDKSGGVAEIYEESNCGLVALKKNVQLKVGATPNVTVGTQTYYALRKR